MDNDFCIGDLSEVLIHATSCEDKYCPSERCEELKRLKKHKKICIWGISIGCRDCLRIYQVTRKHAKRCDFLECELPMCSEIKERMKAYKKKQRNEILENQERRLRLVRKVLWERPVITAIFEFDQDEPIINGLNLDKSISNGFNLEERRSLSINPSTILKNSPVKNTEDFTEMENCPKVLPMKRKIEEDEEVRPPKRMKRKMSKPKIEPLKWSMDKLDLIRDKSGHVKTVFVKYSPVKSSPSKRIKKSKPRIETLTGSTLDLDYLTNLAKAGHVESGYVKSSPVKVSLPKAMKMDFGTIELSPTKPLPSKSSMTKSILKKPLPIKSEKLETSVNGYQSWETLSQSEEESMKDDDLKDVFKESFIIPV